MAVVVGTPQRPQRWVGDCYGRRHHHHPQPRQQPTIATAWLSSSSTWSEDVDSEFLQLAVDCAKRGVGHTFPNPAVGCVVVDAQSKQILGRGFHPRAGFPHAEIFALWQAFNHVDCGIAAAESVLQPDANKNLYDRVVELSQVYGQPGGPEQLFGTGMASATSQPETSVAEVTVYVTLEPCCHTGKQTRPCAATLAALSRNNGNSDKGVVVVTRVVIGCRDPNPRVNGGGVQVLQQANIGVDVAPLHIKVTTECGKLLTNFHKRMTRMAASRSDGELAAAHYYSYITGAIRRGLRSTAARQQAAGMLPIVLWGGDSIDIKNNNNDDAVEAAVQELTMAPEWMEHVDNMLWQHELILLRLNKAVNKRKAAVQLGERIAEQLQAHVAQTKGHTVLLYRPGIPPVLDLKQFVSGGDETDTGSAEGKDEP